MLFIILLLELDTFKNFALIFFSDICRLIVVTVRLAEYDFTKQFVNFYFVRQIEGYICKNFCVSLP
jgi:hypothetical protein